jgi:hypothetical protein
VPGCQAQTSQPSEPLHFSVVGLGNHKEGKVKIPGVTDVIEKITITVADLPGRERNRLLDLLDDVIDLDGEYVCFRRETPSGGPAVIHYRTIDPEKIFADMSVAACMARYDATRNRILCHIRAGDISASMSGIEYYPCAAIDLNLAENEYDIKTSLTWNGEKRIYRPTWRKEFTAWKAL